MNRIKMDIHCLNKLTWLVFSLRGAKRVVYDRFDLLQNFTYNPDSLLRRVRPSVVHLQRTILATKPVIIAPSTSNSMAQKTLHDYSTPFATNVPVGPDVSNGGENFEIKMDLITMVQANPFCGKANEDTSAHLRQFLELCSTFIIKGVSKMLPGFDCFCFLFWGERSIGSMLTRVQ